MSVQAITWSLGRASTIAAQAVLFSLANHANEWGITFVGQDTVASECACRRPTVTTNLAKLEEDGLIARVRRHTPDGRRSSDIIVLAPCALDRGSMRPADRNAASMFSAEVCSLAQPCTPSEPSLDLTDSPRTPDARQGTPHGRLGTPSVHEPSEEPSEEPSDQPPPSADARVKSDPWEFSTPEMREVGEAFLSQKRKVGTRLVTAEEMGIAASAMSEFNRQLGADQGLAAPLSEIVSRVRDHPTWDSAKHVWLVQSAFRIKWWENRGDRRRPKPGVIWGPRSFPNVVDDATREADAIREARRNVSLSDKVWPDGRRWDELTGNEQRHAREAVAIGERPWEARTVEPDSPVSGSGQSLDADNFIGDSDTEAA